MSTLTIELFLHDAMLEAGALGCFDSGQVDLAANPISMAGRGPGSQG